MEETIKPKSLIYNTIMMYLMTIAKIVIPLISLPYLTRVLSVDCYGSVSFAKSIISYLQLVIDFGFLLSATKDIIELSKKKQDVSKPIGDTLMAQVLLVILSFIILTICCCCFDILDGYALFSFLYLISISLTIFMHEYVFKAFEQMDKIAIRYVLMKVISLILTLIFVKNDGDILLIPIFEIISSLIAVILVQFQLRKLGIKINNISFKRIKDCLHALKDSTIYFISDFATSAFSLLGTLLIGIFLTKADVAYWTVAIQLQTAIQAFYAPIINAVYPKMIKERNLKIIHRILLIFIPIILVGCILIWLIGDWIITLVFTQEYLLSSKILKYITPLLILSFASMLYGWPCLACINQQKLATISTVVSACVQIVGFIVLGITGYFTIINIAIIKNVVEFVLCSIRMIACYKHKNCYCQCIDNSNNQSI